MRMRAAVVRKIDIKDRKMLKKKTKVMSTMWRGERIMSSPATMQSKSQAANGQQSNVGTIFFLTHYTVSLHSRKHASTRG